MLKDGRSASCQRWVLCMVRGGLFCLALMREQGGNIEFTEMHLSANHLDGHIELGEFSSVNNSQIYVI